MPQIFLLRFTGFLFAIMVPVFIGKEFYFIALMCTLACMTCIAHQPTATKAVRYNSQK